MNTKENNNESRPVVKFITNSKKTAYDVQYEKEIERLEQELVKMRQSIFRKWSCAISAVKN